MQSNYQYAPKQVAEIVIRAYAFEFPDDLEPQWVPGNSVRSHLFNGMSLTMPYLEPYLIKSFKKGCRLGQHLHVPLP